MGGSKSLLRTECQMTVLGKFLIAWPRGSLVLGLLIIPGRIVSTGLNAAVRAARGEVILRMDVHTVTLRTISAMSDGSGSRQVLITWVVPHARRQQLTSIRRFVPLITLVSLWEEHGSTTSNMKAT